MMALVRGLDGRARGAGRRARFLLVLTLTAAPVAGCNAAGITIGKPATPTQLSLFPGAHFTGSIFVASGGRIWKVQGQTVTAVTPAGQSWDYPAVTPDGQVTAAAIVGHGHAEIALGGADFAGLTPLTKAPADPHRGSIDIKPTLSIDGRRLAFMSDRGTTTDEAIWEGSIKVGRPRQVSFPPGYSGGDDAPAYLADGTGLVYVTWRSDQGSLAEAPVPSGRTRALVSATDGDLLDPAPGPGGRLAVVRRKGGRSDLVVAPDASAIDAAPLTSFGDVRQAAWSPDGNTVVFISHREGTFDLWSIPAAGGTASRLTWGADLDANSRPAWSN